MDRQTRREKKGEKDGDSNGDEPFLIRGCFNPFEPRTVPQVVGGPEKGKIKDEFFYVVFIMGR